MRYDLTDRQTDKPNYSNPRCACAPRVNNATRVEGNKELEEREREGESERLAIPVTLEVHEVVLGGNEVDGPAPGDGVD